MDEAKKILKKVNQLLDDESISSYRINKETQIAIATLHRLRTGKSKVEYMQFRSVMALYQFYIDYEKKLKKQKKEKNK